MRPNNLYRIFFIILENFYKFLYLNKNKKAGIPTVHHTSTIGDYVVMIIDYLDKNLEELLNIMKEKKFSLKTVLMIADQIVIL